MAVDCCPLSPLTGRNSSTGRVRFGSCVRVLGRVQDPDVEIEADPYNKSIGVSRSRIRPNAHYCMY
jgi:hypothetical protein